MKEKRRRMKHLSQIVSTKAVNHLKKAISLTALIATIVVFVVLIVDNGSFCKEIVKEYNTGIESSINKKISFIETIAAGVSSGAISPEDYYSYVDKMVTLYDDVSAVYICVPEDGVIYSDGIMTYMSGGWLPPADFVVSERGWYVGAMEKAGLYLTDPYVDEQSGDICITIAHVVDTPGGKGVVGLDMYMTDLVSLAESSYSGDNYISIVSGNGTILTHPNKEYALSVSNQTNITETSYGRIIDEDLKSAVIWDYKGGFKLFIHKQSEVTGWSIIYASSLGGIFLLLVGIVIAVVLSVAVSAKLSSANLIKTISPMFAPLEDVANNVVAITDGNLQFRFEEDKQSAEVNQVTLALNNTIRGLDYYITEINKVVSSIADKDLSIEVNGDYRGDYRQIKNSLQHILEVLNNSFDEINSQSKTVKEFAANLSQTSESVAESATSQSQSVANANEQMNKLVVSMQEIGELAKAVEQNANDTNSRLTVGAKEMEDLVAAIDEIVTCFDGIAEFIMEINNIASQTNLLSLNASIEAARAGESGRGFAVVASEIQELSANSSRASNNINDIIGKSRVAVNNGKALVEKTQKTIMDGISYSIENAKNVDEIVAAVGTQKASIEEISHSFKEISDMVETNAASAEENSAIANQLGDCAEILSNTVNEFKLR